MTRLGAASSDIELPIVNGGTGASTAAAARANLGFASTTTDNAVSRYDSTAGATQNSQVTISDNGSIFAIGETDTEIEIASRGYGITAVLHNYSAGGTLALPTALTAGALLGGYGSRPFIGSGSWSPHSTAAIHFLANETMSATNQGTTFRILVTPTGTTEANRITAVQFLSNSSAEGAKWQSDFSNSTHKLRTLLQTSTTNGDTKVGLVPNGSGALSQFNAFNTADPTNSVYTALKTDATYSQLLSGQTGSGTSLPLRIIVNNTTPVAEWSTTGVLTLTGEWSGWVEDDDTWTRTANHTFTISGDQTARFPKGARVRYKDGGSYEYGSVSSSSFASSTTTVNLIANSDYAMAAATITNPAVSYELCPQGYPTWFNYTATNAGYSSDPTSIVSKFKVEGNTCTVYRRETANGTSNATTTTFTAPVAGATVANMRWTGPSTIIDNGTTGTTPGFLNMSSAGTVIDCYKNADLGATGWTNTGSKRGCAAGHITYEF